MTKTSIFVSVRVENTVGKGEMLVTSILNLDQFKILSSVNPLPDDKGLDWYKLKQIADNILKCI